MLRYSGEKSRLEKCIHGYVSVVAACARPNSLATSCNHEVPIQDHRPILKEGFIHCHDIEPRNQTVADASSLVSPVDVQHTYG